MLFASLFVAASLASCSSTNVVLAKQDVGVERSIDFGEYDGRRSIRLQYDRVKLLDRPVASPTVCYACEGEKESDGQAAFTLQFFAVNKTEFPWQIDSEMFQLIDVDGDADIERVGSGIVVGTVAPWSTSRVSVLFEIRNVDAERKSSRLWGEYLLRVRHVQAVGGEAVSELLLERQLAIGTFRQGEQALRFVGVFAGALLLIGIL